MIRKCTEADFDTMYEIINDSAIAYKGVIPSDSWKEPYMAKEELKRQIEEGVSFWGFEDRNVLVGIMGAQAVDDVTLIRHAYVRTPYRNRGVGSELIRFALERISTPVLVGTWANAVWAIRFYEKNGFRRVSTEEKNRLLRTYWNIPKRQVETSVVLADQKWIDSGIRVHPNESLQMKRTIPGAGMWAVSLERSMLTYFEFDPETQFPEHSHEAEQITLVLEGELTFAFAGKSVNLKKGDVIAIPSNAVHSVSTGRLPCKAVDAWSSVRKECL